jgi:hypothetical protein
MASAAPSSSNMRRSSAGTPQRMVTRSARIIASRLPTPDVGRERTSCRPPQSSAARLTVNPAVVLNALSDRKQSPRLRCMLRIARRTRDSAIPFGWPVLPEV